MATRNLNDSAIVRWNAMAGTTGRLATMAGLGGGAVCADAAELLPLFENANGWQRAVSSEAIADITAMLASGMAALDVLERRGVDARIPALALWREVDAAQRSLIAMLASDARA